MANGIYKVTEEFEEELSKYTGAKFAVTVDNMSNGLFLALMYEKETIYLPLEKSFYFICNTYNNSNGLYVLRIKE